MTVTELILVRHGESIGNVAATAAQRSGAETIDLAFRDADVPLSDTGVEQVTALGDWLARLPEAERPDAVWCSPYLRARQTAQIACDRAGLALPWRVDERIRDRELGILDLLTAVGVENRFPAEAARRRWLGKFYYRPPGGESWVDVALRVRSALADIDRLPDVGRLLVVVHDAVVLLFRYVCELLSEDQLLEIGRTTSVLNASVTRLTRDAAGGPWVLQAFNLATHLQAAGAPVTEHGGDADVSPH